MARGRPPQGQQPLTGAQREARWRARHAGAPITRWRQPADRRSRSQRWRDAVAELLALQAEYVHWLAAIPQVTGDGATAEALQAIVDLDLSELADLDPPRGFGRD